MEMTPRLFVDSRNNRRMPVSQITDADTGNQIEVAPSIPAIEPRSLGTLDYESNRGVGGLREMAPEKLGGLIHI
jgi:hypothetical protein